MAFQKAKSGQALSIPAGDYNAMIDAAVAHRAGRSGTGRPHPFYPSSTIIAARNVTDDAIDRYRAVWLEAPAAPPNGQLAQDREFLRRVVFNVKQPTGSSIGKWGVIQRAAGPGRIVECVVAGVSICRIHLANTADTTCEVVTGDYVPRSNTTGSAQILWVAGGVTTATTTGEQWALLRMPMGGAAASIGQYQGQAHMMVVNNADGWEFPFLHPVP